MAKFNENNQCELIVKGILDKEEGVNTFEAMVKLKTQSAFANPARMISTVSYLDFYFHLIADLVYPTIRIKSQFVKNSKSSQKDNVSLRIGLVKLSYSAQKMQLKDSVHTFTVFFVFNSISFNINVKYFKY